MQPNMHPNDQHGSADGSHTEFAKAKVNLALHITGQREDGYHLLDSLVVFPQIGDRLTFRQSATQDTVKPDEFHLSGPQAQALNTSAADDNLVLKALKLHREATRTPIGQLSIELEKNLPVASGIGGGSADAAASLRLLQRLAATPLNDETLADMALKLGADVPVCLKQEACRMEGIGENISAIPKLPDCGMVLVNPGVAVSTPAIFKSLKSRNNSAMPAFPERFETLDALITYLQTTRNDMQEAATALCPEIADVLQALRALPQTRLSRMSGSGATCFALCDTDKAQEISQQIQKDHPDWWVASSNSI